MTTIRELEPERTRPRAPFVLVADDSAIHRTAMIAMLERAGFEAEAAHDGAALLDSVRRRRPDLVILDALMPTLSGFETLVALRAASDLSTIPVIVVSGLEDVQSRVDALALGADDFVTKPVDAAELTARIRAQLRVADAWNERLTETSDHVAELRRRIAGTASAADEELRAWFDELLDRRAFDLHFQPVVDLRSGRIRAHEALARFHDGTAPGQVLQAAARFDRLIELELDLVRLAVERSAALPEGVKVHVNVSPSAALDPTLPGIVAACRRLVVLEITENAALDPEQVALLRSRLPVNCSIAADDVGAGYAGLSQLLALRPDVIKIDRAVVVDVHRDPARQALVAGLVRFSATTGATVIAEGIEHREEAEALLALGVRDGQGYYFSRPVPLLEASQQHRCVPATDPVRRRSPLRRLIRS